MDSIHSTISQSYEAVSPQSETSIDNSRLDDERAVNRILRRILETRGYQQRVKRWAEEEVRRSERQEERLMKFFGGRLEAWLRSELGRRRGHQKSVNLPAGRLGVRRIKAQVHVADEQALLEWATESAPQMIRHSSRIAKEGLNQYIVQTGEIPPGAEWKPDSERFYLK